MLTKKVAYIKLKMLAKVFLFKVFGLSQVTKQVFGTCHVAAAIHHRSKETFCFP